MLIVSEDRKKIVTRKVGFKVVFFDFRLSFLCGATIMDWLSGYHIFLW